MTNKKHKGSSDMAELLLLRERFENEADYRTRGRYMKQLSNEALKQRWFAHLRREFIELERHRSEGNDIAAELALRGLAISDLPDDIARAMQADVDRLVSRYSRESKH